MPESAPPLRAVFVAGTGTDVGKTVITAGLLRALRGLGVAAQAVKKEGETVLQGSYIMKESARHSAGHRRK